MVLAGQSKAQIFEGMKAWVKQGMPPLEPGAMSFMMSKEQHLNDGSSPQLDGSPDVLHSSHGRFRLGCRSAPFSRDAASTLPGQSGTDRRIHGSRGLVVGWNAGPSQAGLATRTNVSGGQSASQSAKRFKLHDQHEKEKETMTVTRTRIAVSRRNLLATGACALVGAAEPAGTGKCQRIGGQNSTNEEIIRKWYAAWERRTWARSIALLADNFTFTSAAGDDHISKSTFKTQCWDTQVDFIGHFELERISHRRGGCFCEVSLPHQERQIVAERGVSPNQERKVAID